MVFVLSRRCHKNNHKNNPPDKEVLVIHIHVMAMKD